MVCSGVRMSLAICFIIARSSSRYVYDCWQNKWNELTHNKLHEIQTVVGKIPAFISLRKDDSAIRRLRIGHTYFTHGYLLRGEPVPECMSCAST